MIITNNRTELDANLKIVKTVIFLLIGGPNSKAEEIHTLMTTKTWDTYQKFYLIGDGSLLTPAEKQSWFNDKTSDWYAVLGGKQLPKSVAVNGPVTDLLKSNGEADYLKILKAFLRGERV